MPCEANCERYLSVLEVIANNLKDNANREKELYRLLVNVQLSEGRVDVWSQEVRIKHGLAIHCAFCNKLF